MTKPAAHPLAAGLPPPWASHWGFDEHGPFAAFTIERATTRMRWIPPGTFTMGSPPKEEGRWADEGPQHRVTLTRGLWLGETPVTQAQWQAAMGDNPSHFPGDDRPVEQVTWDQCQQYCRLVGGDARLPTEAEWEYACRGGSQTASSVGDPAIVGANNPVRLEELAWYGDNSGGETHPVGQKAANPFGLYDMLGNVWEWCEDVRGPYTADDAIDPISHGDSGDDRVLRGGSFHYHARDVRAAYRNALPPGYRYSDIGFRLARGQGAGG